LKIRRRSLWSAALLGLPPCRRFGRAYPACRRSAPLRLRRPQCGEAAPYRWVKASSLPAARPPLRTAIAACLALCALLITACGPQKMASQPKYIPLRSTNFFEDGKSERPLVEGTVPHGFDRTDTAFYTGKTGPQQTMASTSAPS